MQEYDISIPSSCKNLNDLMTPRGVSPRFISRGITHIYGTAGSLKTTIALDVGLNAVKMGLTVLYEETENGIDLPRLQAMCKAKGLDKDLIADKSGVITVGSMRIERAPDMETLVNSIFTVQQHKLDVYIADCPVSHYLVQCCTDAKEYKYGKPSKQNFYYLGQLEVFCGQWRLAVLLTGRPISDVKKADILEFEKGIDVGTGDQRDYAGGAAYEFYPKERVKLSKLGHTLREAEIRKHRSKPTGIKTKFQVTEDGIADV